MLKIKEKEKQIEFQVHCSKGTYIRSLCEDIAKRINTEGYMSELTRMQVGDFSIEQAGSMQQLENGEVQCISIEEFFNDKKQILLECSKLQHFLNGVKLTVKEPNDVYRIYCNQKFIGMGIVEEELLKRDIIL